MSSESKHKLPNPNDFPAVLAYNRKAVCGFTQEKLADKLGVDKTVISKWESGRYKPAPEMVNQVIQALASEKEGTAKREELTRALWNAYSQGAAPSVEVALPDQQLLERVGRMLSELPASDVGADFRASMTDLVSVYGLVAQAEEAARDKDWRKVRRWSNEAESALRASSELLRMKVNRLQGEGLLHLAGQAEEARVPLLLALWQAKRLRHLRAQAEINLLLGDAAQRCSSVRWSEAKQRYDTAKELFEYHLNDKRHAAECMRKRATVELYLGRPRQALAQLENSRKAYEEHGDSEVRGTIKVLQHEAWAYDMLGQWEKAVAKAQEADEKVALHLSEDLVECGKSKRYLGDAYRINREHDEAERAYNRGLEFVEGLPEEDSEVTQVRAMCLLGRAKVHLKHRGRETNAWDDLEASSTMHREVKSDFRYAEVLTEQGELYLKLEAFDDALTSLWQAAELFARFPNYFYHASALAELAALFYELGEVEQLLDMLAQTRAIAARAEADDNPDLLNYQLSRILYLVGRQHADAGKPEEAVPFLIEALERAQKFNWKTFKEMASRIEDGVEHAFDPTTRIIICELLVSFWRGSHPGLSEDQQAYIEHWCDCMERVADRAPALEDGDSSDA